MTIAVKARQRLGDFELDIAFESRGRLMALFGPSGSGKSTIVNLIAGLIPLRDGRIVIDGQTLDDTDQRLHVPKHRRRIGYVFQDARLFPHLTVEQNLKYGRFFAPTADKHPDPRRVIGLLGIAPLLSRRPHTLSGGEKQRVAIGRALLSSPRLMLMDEPLASLDLARKAEILPYIEQLRDAMGVPIIYVSHAIDEVLRLASDVVMIEAGRVRATGPIAEIVPQLDRGSVEQRDEIGALLDLEVVEHSADGLTLLRGASGDWRTPKFEASVGTFVRARVRARDVILATVRPTGISALNILSGVIESVSQGDDPDLLVTIACGADHILARITRHSASVLGLAAGRSVHVIVKAVTLGDQNQPHLRPKGD
jgi:molybdate transport system ATP-binding protein